MSNLRQSSRRSELPTPLCVAGAEAVGRRIQLKPKASQNIQNWLVGQITSFKALTGEHKFLSDQDWLESWVKLGSRQYRWLSRSPRSDMPNPTYANFPGNQEAVGWKIRVFWSEMGKWYTGWVKSYDPSSKMHKVAFCDGDVRFYVLRHEPIQWVEKRCANSTSASSKKDKSFFNKSEEESSSASYHGEAAKNISEQNGEAMISTRSKIENEEEIYTSFFEDEQGEGDEEYSSLKYAEFMDSSVMSNDSKLRKRTKVGITDPDLSILINCRVGIYLQSHKRYYKALLKHYDKCSGKFTVKYDDGREELLDLKQEVLEWYGPRGKSAGYTTALKSAILQLRVQNIPQKVYNILYPSGRDLEDIYCVDSVSRRVYIFWEADGQYYEAEVLIYCKLKRKYFVVYRDGEAEWLDLRRENVIFGEDEKSHKDFSAGLDIGYNASTRKHEIVYDDGDKEKLMLSKEKVIWQLPPNLSHPKRSASSDGDVRPVSRKPTQESKTNDSFIDSQSLQNNSLGKRRKSGVKSRRTGGIMKRSSKEKIKIRKNNHNSAVGSSEQPISYDSPLLPNSLDLDIRSSGINNIEDESILSNVDTPSSRDRGNCAKSGDELEKFDSVVECGSHRAAKFDGVVEIGEESELVIADAALQEKVAYCDSSKAPAVIPQHKLSNAHTFDGKLKPLKDQIEPTEVDSPDTAMIDLDYYDTVYFPKISREKSVVMFPFYIDDISDEEDEIEDQTYANNSEAVEIKSEEMNSVEIETSGFTDVLRCARLPSEFGGMHIDIRISTGESDEKPNIQTNRAVSETPPPNPKSQMNSAEKDKEGIKAILEFVKQCQQTWKVRNTCTAEEQEDGMLINNSYYPKVEFDIPGQPEKCTVVKSVETPVSVKNPPNVLSSIHPRVRNLKRKSKSLKTEILPVSQILTKDSAGSLCNSDGCQNKGTNVSLPPTFLNKIPQKQLKVSSLSKIAVATAASTVLPQKALTAAAQPVQKKSFFEEAAKAQQHRIRSSNLFKVEPIRPSNLFCGKDFKSMQALRNKKFLPSFGIPEVKPKDSLLNSASSEMGKLDALKKVSVFIGSSNKCDVPNEKMIRDN